MKGLYKWECEIDKQLVLVKYHGNIRIKIIEVASKFNGKDISNNFAFDSNSIVLQFDFPKTAIKFVDELSSSFPNFFSLNFDWTMKIANETEATFSSVAQVQEDDLEEFSKKTALILEDAKCIFTMIPAKLSKPELSVSNGICYFIYTASFVSKEILKTTLEEFYALKRLK